ncbi:hypothetical protein DB88DRAFT_499063 [Papiliotrema laurentii]|uniref:SMP-30/Gluconolactonase/LRE-like region domain-containing protein n=1 Tax=Papiliotrema laurentii TaxID=5418 RepID=A0AAD9CVY9_PAPLA|nr:hypothetical protein DB88DRAFT_499063 [Papiliotrema laurentii]
MIYLPAAFVAVSAALFFRSESNVYAWSDADIPDQAQRIYPKNFAVLDYVPPPTVANLSTQFVPPGYTLEGLKNKPFHIYDEEFYAIIGSNPSLTLLAETNGDPLFHEAVAWYPPTDEVFFVQNAGAKAAGTGLQKSAITQKIALSQVANVTASGERSVAGKVDVVTVDANPAIVNPNGATNYKGGLVFMGEGQGDNITSAIYYLHPEPPYNTTVLLNNYFGRQFNSLNDVAVSPRTKELYFTDVTYGYLQDFRPTPGFPNQVYRFNEKTGLVSIAADGFNKPNGITFSPDGKYAYIADTGAGLGFYGNNQTYPTTIYRFDVEDDGTWSGRKTFAYVTPGLPDGIHCDDKGNVYAGCGDGIQVWNPSGKLIGKIFIGETSANFRESPLTTRLDLYR